MSSSPLFVTRLGLSTSLVVAALAAGCASNVKLKDTPVETHQPAAAASAPAQAPAQSSVAKVEITPEQLLDAAKQAGRTVYFDFDSFVVKDDFRPVVEANAKYLSAVKSAHMVLEGNTDERGSREYNLALGQKRAEAVQKSLVLLGVSEGQLEAVSYGEERPAAQGHNEEAWAKNRRVELKDR